MLTDTIRRHEDQWAILLGRSMECNSFAFYALVQTRTGRR